MINFLLALQGCLQDSYPIQFSLFLRKGQLTL